MLSTLATHFGTELALPYGVAPAVLWVRADAMRMADGTRVFSWPDLSGNDNDMTEPFATRQPEFENNVWGSMPGVLFESPRDSKLETAGPATTVVDNWTMFLVADPLVPDTTTGSHSGLVPFTNGEGGSGYGIAFNIDPAGISTGAETKGIHFGGVGRFYSADPPDSDPHIWMLRRTAGTTELYVDGGSPILTTATAPSTPTTFTRLGSQQDTFAAAQFNGYIAEAILWDVALDDTDANTVGNALERWPGFTWADI